MSWGWLVFLVSLAVPFLAGFAIGRWLLLVGVAAAWLAIAIFLRANNGWHGAGWGDFGVLLNVIWAVMTFGLAVLGISLRKLGERERAAA